MSDKSIDDAIRDGIISAMAHQVAAALDGPKRDAILAAGVAQVLGGYEFKRLVEKAIGERAQVLVAEAIASGAFDARVTEAIRAGFDRVLGVLPAAVTESVAEALAGHGYRGTYDSGGPGLLQKVLAKKLEGQP